MSAALTLALVFGAAVLLFEVATGGALSRLAFHLATVGLIHLDLMAVKLVRRIAPARHVLVGDCFRCGACCKSIVLDPPAFIKRRALLLRALAAYHRVAHNFEAYARGPSGEVLFRCGHLRVDHTCGIYWRRPLLCRNYPLVPELAAPGLLPDCTYRVTARSTLTMQRRPSLRILNEHVAVHHPSPHERTELGLPEHYELVDPTLPSSPP